MFRRRRRGNPNDESDDSGNPPSDDGPDGGDGAGEVSAGGVGVEPAPAVAEPVGLTPRPNGPWDVSDVPDGDAERFDLGGLKLAIPDGAQVQLDVTPDGMVVPTVFVGEGAVQISAFAAPRRTGIWSEIRAEIAESLTEAGGAVAEVDGVFGTELHGQVPVELPDGSVGFQLARFVGVDGPRWFLRGLFTGEAVDSTTAGTLEDGFRGTVVVRGSEAMAPRDPLPVNVPREILEAAAAEEDQLLPEEMSSESAPDDQRALAPFQRGPEITEVR